MFVYLCENVVRRCIIYRTKFCFSFLIVNFDPERLGLDSSQGQIRCRYLARVRSTLVYRARVRSYSYKELGSVLDAKLGLDLFQMPSYGQIRSQMPSQGQIHSSYRARVRSIISYKPLQLQKQGQTQSRFRVRSNLVSLQS